MLLVPSSRLCFPATRLVGQSAEAAASRGAERRAHPLSMSGLEIVDRGSDIWSTRAVTAARPSPTNYDHRAVLHNGSGVMKDRLVGRSHYSGGGGTCGVGDP